MYGSVAKLLDVLEVHERAAGELISWSCPVPFFGHLERASLATVGINPSNREFVDTRGDELAPGDHRFPTLRSLALTSWGEADHDVLITILEACRGYFDRNPYDQWFGALERLFAATGCSYYSPVANACHLDIVPWATSEKWGTLPPRTRDRLVHRAAGALVDMIIDSPLTLLVLNGQEVVRRFETLSGRPLSPRPAPGWNLPRRSGPPVQGIAFRDVLTSIGGFPLDRELLVLGYNHNVQSSFGVTNGARAAIGEWIATEYQTLAA